MTEKRLIQGSYVTRRFLHSDEVFHKERNWNINLPNEREFKNGYCIVTDKEDTAYSIDELIELLNTFQKENEKLKKEVTYRKEQLDVYKQKVVRTLEKEYNLIEDNEHIPNNEKIVAKLEIEKLKEELRDS